MFVQRIGNLDKTRFGINFKAEDIKCDIKSKYQKKTLKDTKDREVNKYE